MTAGTSRSVVIVGAGVGGMCAAALLAARGYRVSIYERLDTVGGRTRTQVIEGYSLPRGAVAFQLTGVLPRIIREVGAEVELRPVNETWFWIKGGSGFVKLPARGGIKKMLEMFMSVEGGNKAQAMTKVALELAITRVGSAFGTSPPAIAEDDSGPTFREWLRQYTDNEGLLSLFHTITSAISAVNDFEYPAKHWFAHFSQKGMDARVDQFAMVSGGYVAVSRALGAVVERQGGEIHLRTPVRRIVTQGGRATGIDIESAGGVRRIPADIVISNAGPIGTLGLTGEDALGREYSERLRARVRPTPIVLTFAVSDEPLFEPRASILAAGLQRIVTGVPLTNICPEWAPDGKHVTSFYGTPKSCLHPMDREDERRANIEDVHSLFPDLERRGGRILDVQLRDIDDPDVVARSWPGHNVPVETPVPNLFNVGDACAPDGFIATPAAGKSAELAVARILEGAAG